MFPFLPTGIETSVVVRLFVGVFWAISAYAYLYAWRNENIVSFRPMRAYAVVLSVLWSVFMFYTAFGLAGWYTLPRVVSTGLLSASLMIPTAGYLVASAWVTHKVIKSWE